MCDKLILSILIKIKTDFLEMLSEDHSLSESSQWRKVKGGLERDPRYRAVSGGSSQREEWFKEYVRSLATTSKVLYIIILCKMIYGKVVLCTLYSKSVWLYGLID